MLKNFSEEQFDIIIQAGQSNCEGYGFGYVDNPYQPCDSVWYLNGDFTISRAAEIVRGNEIQGTLVLSFVREYINNGLLENGRKILVLRSAVGGTGFIDNHWNMTGTLYLRLLEMIHTSLELNDMNRLVCILWHQGENDAGKNATYEVHYNHLMELVRSLRKEFSMPDLPFIAGDFVPQWKSNNIEICKPVVEAIHAVCLDCGYGAFVETDGLSSNQQENCHNPLGWKDTIHFSRNAVYSLGERYFNAFCGILKEQREGDIGAFKVLKDIM